MLFIILSIADIVAGAAIYSPAFLGFFTKLIWLLTIVLLLKGFYTIICSFSVGYFFEWPGALDMIAGFALFLLLADFISASHLLGGVVMGKGAYYLIRSLLSM